MTRLILNLAVITCVLIGPTFAQSACAVGECDRNDFPGSMVLSPSRDCYGHTDEVDLSCPDGIFGGPPTNICNNGSWMSPIASCQVFNCTTPDIGGPASNVQLIPEKEIYGTAETVEYRCPQGYQLNGPSNATCSDQNVWNPASTPSCAAICDAPRLVNGNVDDGTFIDGQTTDVNCDAGYSLAAGSSIVITCTDGEWGDLPICYESCINPPVNGSDYSSSNITNLHGETVIVRCDPGKSFDKQISFSLTCDDGNFIGSVPDQCYDNCLCPVKPGNGSVSESNVCYHDQTVYYSCDRGFKLNGNSSITCSNGIWSSNDAPVCEEQTLENSITLFCEPDKFVVEIPGPLLGQNPTLQSVALGTCEGTSYDGEFMYVNSSYTDCGTTIEEDSDLRAVIYRNSLTSVATGIVTTIEYLEVSTVCVFDQENKVSSSAIINAPIIQDLDESSKFDISFKVFSDPGYLNEVTESTLVDTNTDIYLLAQVNYVTNVDLFPTRCYATPQPEADYHTFIDLIDDGCDQTPLVDTLVTDATNKPNFGFRATVFRFTTDAADRIYIHCDLKVCPRDMCNLPTTCSNRRRRATDVTFSRHVSTGPIRMTSEESTAAESNWQVTALTVYSALISAVMMTVIGLMVAVRYRRNKPSSEP